LGRFLLIDLSGLECWVGEEEFAPGYRFVVAGKVAARRARIAKQWDERLANVLSGDLRVHLDKAVEELGFVEDTLSSNRAA
jgi:hypothetical protein